MSRTRFVIIFCGCPLILCSKLQTKITIFITEVEKIALSQATRKVLLMMELLKEINSVFTLNILTPEIYCKVYEDNESCTSITKAQHFSSRTKLIDTMYHHFRNHVKSGLLKNVSIDTKEQTADIFTKPLDKVYLFI